jgi:hypothetical protein
LANSLSHGRVRFQFFLNEGLFFLGLIDSLSLGITDSETDVEYVSIVLFFSVSISISLIEHPKFLSL